MDNKINTITDIYGRWREEIEGSSISINNTLLDPENKIYVLEVLGDIYQDDNYEIYNIGELQGDGTYRIDLKSAGNDSELFIKDIYLPQSLNGVNGTRDKLYWDIEKGHYCIEKKIDIFKIPINSFNFSTAEQDHSYRIMENGSQSLNVFQIPNVPSTSANNKSELNENNSIVEGFKSLNMYNLSWENGTISSKKNTFGYELNNSNWWKYIFRVLKTSVSSSAEALAYVKSKEWTVYYISTNPTIIDLPHLNKKIELDTFTPQTSVTVNSSNCNPILKLSVPFRKADALVQPTGLSVDMSNFQTVISWDYQDKVEYYNIYLNNELLGKLNSNRYTTDNEIQGNVHVTAHNSAYESPPSEPLYVKTVPNAPLNIGIISTSDKEKYNFTLNFIDNSEIETNYRVEYSVDDAAFECINIDSFIGVGSEISCGFVVNEILNKIVINVYALNDVGQSNLINPIILYAPPESKWTYKISSQGVLISWIDTSELESFYKIKYSIDDSDIWNYEVVEGDLDATNRKIDKLISLNSTSKINYSICSIINGIDQIYSKIKTVGKTLDTTLIPPLDFGYRWVDRGFVEFYWKDNYRCEDYFEVSYYVNGGNEITERINSTTVDSIGNEYVFRYQLKEHDTITARVRMKWELNESEYTSILSALFLPVTGLPPSYIKKSRTNDGVIIEWEAQEYVEAYNLHYINGPNEEIFSLSDNIKYIPIDYCKSKSIEIYVITKFVGGVISDKSASLSWNPTSYIAELISSIKNKNTDYYSLKTTCIDKIYDSFAINSITWNRTSIEYNLSASIISKFLLSQFPYEISIFEKNQKNKYLDIQSIYTKNIESKNDILTTTYTKTKESNSIGFNIFTKIKESYDIVTEINQIRILCFGDSITSGHPGYWAETGTGDPQHCYEYWLDRRLKKAYEIINKGYGSDTTDMMLDRFNKDVLPYNTQFCIIQGGTNDLYWAMAEADGDQVELDRRVERMKNNIIEMVKRCNDNKIIPVIGTLIPRTGAIGIYKAALYEYNQWIKDYCNLKGIAYVDWFNAGKKNIPATPLEDPVNPGALNPLYDGDAIYDEFGNIIKQGRGIHPNKAGYKIMGDEIPLSIFRTYDTGLKLYLDRDCLQEEKYNDDDKMNPFYTITINDLRLTKTKTLIRYIKNIGVIQTLFSMYVSKKYNAKVEFIDSKGNKFDYVNGLLHSEKVIGVKIDVTALTEDNTSVVDFYLAGREIKFNN